MGARAGRLRHGDGRAGILKGVNARRPMPVNAGRWIRRLMPRTGSITVGTSCTRGRHATSSRSSGMAFRGEHEVTLKPGQSVRDDQSPFGHTRRLTRLGASSSRRATGSSRRHGSNVPRTESPGGDEVRKRQHVDSFNRPTFEPSTEVGIRSGLQEDLYITYAGSVNGTEEAVYRFTINPLVWWLWFGGCPGVRRGRDTLPGGDPTVGAAPRRAVAGYEVERWWGERRNERALGRRDFLGRLGAGWGPSAARRPAVTGFPRGVGAAKARCATPTPWVSRGGRVTRIEDYDERRIKTIEHRLACNCGCTLDVFTCRTTETHLQLLAEAASRGGGDGGQGGEVRPDSRRVRGEVRREGPDGAQAGGFSCGLCPPRVLDSGGGRGPLRCSSAAAEWAVAEDGGAPPGGAGRRVPRARHRSSGSGCARRWREVEGLVLAEKLSAAVLLRALALWLVLWPVFAGGAPRPGSSRPIPRRRSCGVALAALQGDRVRPRDRQAVRRRLRLPQGEVHRGLRSRRCEPEATRRYRGHGCRAGPGGAPASAPSPGAMVCAACGPRPEPDAVFCSGGVLRLGRCPGNASAAGPRWPPTPGVRLPAWPPSRPTATTGRAPPLPV